MHPDTRTPSKRLATMTRAAAAVISVGAMTLMSSPAFAATHSGSSWGTNSRTAPAATPATPATPAAPAAPAQPAGTHTNSVLSADATTKALTPTSGILMGASSMGHAGMNNLTAFATLQTQTQHPFNLHRDYSSWGDAQPSGAVQWDLARGLIPALSIVAKQGGKPVKWADIAAGKQDAQIIKTANALKATGKPILLTFHHEPENDPGNGTPADYRAAWRHYVSVFRAQGVTNVKFAWIMMGYSFSKKGFDANAYYPGDDVIDWLGVDGYNFFGCTGGGKNWKSFAQVFAPFRAFAAQHPSKPIIIAEFGSQEDPANPGRKGQWLRDAASTLQGWSQVKAISYWNADMACSWYLDSSSSSMAGWRSLVSNSALQPRFSNVSTTNPPTVSLTSPQTTQNTVTVRGTVNPNGAASSYYVQYGTTTSYGKSTATTNVAAGAGATSVSVPVSGLAAGTTYHVRLVATNSGGTSVTPDMVVATVPAPAAPQLRSAVTAMTTQTSATVSGSVRYFGVAGSYHVEYGLTSSYGSRTASVSVASGSDLIRFNSVLSNLLSASTYHYRVVFTNSAGTTSTADQTATTPQMVLPGHLGNANPPPAMWGWQTATSRIRVWAASMVW